MRSSASFWPLVSIDRKQALRTLHAMESFRRLRREKTYTGVSIRELSWPA